MNKQKFFIVAIIAMFIALPLTADVNKQKSEHTTWSINRVNSTFLLAENTGKRNKFSKNSAGYTDINASKLYEMMLNKNFTLVNVHIPYEGELPHTDLFIAFNKITKPENLDKLPDKNSTIVLYCRSGSMSTSAAKELVKIGYTNILELNGGFKAWKAEGYKFLKK
ncbi:MAG: rhodanese-like domain-containing protein [Spirochaetota bacterium]|nr:MAG: rhodanese-like domain-containing protein [Spirochaetota bacterium]